MKKEMEMKKKEKMKKKKMENMMENKKNRHLVSMTLLS